MKRSAVVCSQRLALLAVMAIFGLTSAHAQRNRLTRVPANSKRFKLAGHVHPLATAANDSGLFDASEQLSDVTLSFAPTAEQQAALDDLLTRQRTAGDPEYHKWLTPEEYADRFGVSPSDVD